MRRSPSVRRLVPVLAVGAAAARRVRERRRLGRHRRAPTRHHGEHRRRHRAPAGTDGRLRRDCAATIEDGTLTIATGEPAFFPWVIDDAPETGEGFEAAVALAVAAEMGYEGDAVVWTRTTFDEAIQPGAKNFDMNLQQYSISDERKENVDMSLPYFTSNQAIVALEGSRRRRCHDRRRPQGRQVRRPGRHHQPRLHQRGHPAHAGRLRLRRQRRRQGCARSEPDRRRGVRPADRAVRLGRRDRGQRRRRPVPRRSRRHHRRVRIRAREGQRR